WGRLHTPCGGPAGVDPQFPNPFGFTGVVGWDAASGALRDATRPDIMGYCGDPWVSDYTYLGVMNFRAGPNALAAAAAAAPMQPCLLVWGRVTASGEVVLEPAFEITARPSLPTRAGGTVVRGQAHDGVELFSLSFDAHTVADRAGADRAFAFAVPLDAARRERLASIVTAHGAREGRTSSPRVASRARTAPTAARVDARRARLRWDAASHPAALVRDVATGRILGIARGGDAVVPTTGAVHLELSDGIRTTRHLLRP
ncbi:MAG TPA: hypothetical protein VEA99_20460, partial [Gemmatimonadaceae bacterium]|nr:hypothetical protein [Gemmatimonadaceae bacterium]